MCSSDLAHVVRYAYSVPGVDDGTEYPYQPRVVEEWVNGKLVAKRFNVWTTNAQGEAQQIEERAGTVSGAWGHTNNLRTVTTYWAETAPPDCAGRVRMIQYPDGRTDTYDYVSGVFMFTPGDPGSYAFAEGGGSDLLTLIVHLPADGAGPLPGRTTRESRVTDSNALERLHAREVFDGDDYQPVEWTVREYDYLGRLSQVHHSDGTREELSWGCCAKESETDRYGIQTLYLYDDLNRAYFTARLAVTNTTSFDAAGRPRRVERRGGAVTMVSSNRYDPAGRLILAVDEAGLTTTYAYESGGRVRTVTNAVGAVTVTTSALDGQTLSITGSAVVAQSFAWGANADGTRWTMTYTGPGTANWARTVTDMLGHTIREERPGYGGGTITNAYVYNARGQLIRHVPPDTRCTLFEYDGYGEQSASGLDINDNGVLDTNGVDRIEATALWYEADGGGDWWRVRATRVFPYPNSAASVTTSVERVRLTGLSSNRTAESVAVDVFGLATTNLTAVNRAAARATQTVIYPDSTNPAATIQANGVVTQSVSKTGVVTVYEYDAFGRQTAARTSSAGGSRSTATLTHYNAQGRVDYVEDAASNRTWYGYDAAGRRVAETNALGKAIRYAYTLRGEQEKIWGDVPYPVSYSYDEWGRMTNMATYRGGSGWSGAAWPTSTVGTADTTTWRYEPATGLLTNKVYADGQGPRYTYTAAGRPATRVWARGVTTTYSYTNTTGELIGTSYSDGTPGVTLAYDRLGRIESVKDVVGTRTFAYTAALVPESETILSQAPFPGVTGKVSRLYDGYGRSAGYTLALGATNAVIARAGYGYDALGRLNAVTWSNAAYQGTGTYSYVAQSDLVEQLAMMGGQLTLKRAYEPTRDVLAAVTNAYGGTALSSFGYGVDALGRRTNRLDAGSQYAPLVTNLFRYNDRNEVTNTLMTTNRAVWSYAYDPIGNRTQTTNSGGGTTNWTCNALNQYTNVGGTKLYYDADGNLTNDGYYSYVWDGENRLIEARKTTVAWGSPKLAMAYDWLGRRVKKERRRWDGRNYAPLGTNVFFYEGWNPIAEQERNVGGAVWGTNLYSWGLDLAEQRGAGVPRHGAPGAAAGGIGGLLSETRQPSLVTRFFAFDGNGNVSDLVGTGGAVAVHYDYDAYGNPTRTSGTDSPTNYFRFSTKYTDQETGLLYYGYRYYSPTLGRWLSRDPIHERGGLNLYAFVKNDPTDKIDPRGLACGVVVKRITADVTGRTDKYGHEWIEVGGGASSYGWWPIDGVSIWDALFGVPGDVNRGRPQDPHNMDVSDITWETEIETRSWIFFSRKLQAGSKAGTPCKCASCGDILDCLDSFAGNYAGKWSIWRSCRTFSAQALSACCLEKGKKTVTTRTYTVP